MSTETLCEEKVVEKEVANHDLIVFNDDINTFDYVIESLVKVCGHNPIQAEQCTMLIHYTGKCQVKAGEFSELTDMCTALLDRGITAEVH